VHNELLYKHIGQINIHAHVLAHVRERERERLEVQVNIETPCTLDYVSNQLLNLPFAKMPLYYLTWPVPELEIDTPANLWKQKHVLRMNQAVNINKITVSQEEKAWMASN
jgi:hypothetical protein